MKFNFSADYRYMGIVEADNEEEAIENIILSFDEVHLPKMNDKIKIASMLMIYGETKEIK